MDVKLVMFKANGQRKEVALSRPVTVIGRAENCEMRIPLESISRRHCEINISGQLVKVKDLASSNGTYVNNRRITEQGIKAGDRLSVGSVVFTFQINGEPAVIEQPVKGKAKPAKSNESDEGAAVLLEDDIAGAGDIDPIAALEALAQESTKKDKK